MARLLCVIKQKMNSDLILIAKITKPHGIRGQVKIMSYASSPRDVFNYPILYDENLKEYKLKMISEIAENMFIGIFNQNTSRNIAEDIAGLKLYITKEMLSKAEENEFYHHDLIGIEIYDQDKNKIGKIIEIQNFGAGDIIEMQPENGKSSIYLPFINEYIKEINLKEKFLVFDFEAAGIEV